MTLKLLYIFTLSWLLIGCSYTNSINSFEDLYTDVKILKPTAKNYTSATSKDATPIIKEPTNTTTNPSQPVSVNIKKIGRIISTTYDTDLKLYLYTFISEPEKEDVIFYYNQKLNYSSANLLKIDVLDNYLISARPYHDKNSLIVPPKKKYIKHKKRNHNIREAIEEKINTF